MIRNKIILGKSVSAEFLVLDGRDENPGNGRVQVLAIVAVGDVQHVLVAVGLRLEVAIVLIDQQLKIVTQRIIWLGLGAICYPDIEVIKVSAMI